MTVQSEKEGRNDVGQEDIVLPDITKEEDIPFPTTYSNQPNTEVEKDNLAISDSLEDEITKFKYLTGRKVLFCSILAMIGMVLLSVGLSVFQVENTLTENAFEVFKLIAMTVLGYIFGTKAK